MPQDATRRLEMKREGRNKMAHIGSVGGEIGYRHRRSVVWIVNEPELAMSRACGKNRTPPCWGKVSAIAIETEARNGTGRAKKSRMNHERKIRTDFGMRDLNGSLVRASDGILRLVHPQVDGLHRRVARNQFAPKTLEGIRWFSRLHARAVVFLRGSLRGLIGLGRCVGVGRVV